MGGTSLWQGKGNGANQKIRVLGWCRDGVRVRFERTAGAPEHVLHTEHRTTMSNIMAAFEPLPSHPAGEAEPEEGNNV